MLIGTTYLVLALGDITQEMADVIVTAANTSLPAGEAVIAAAGDLLARHVVHTVGPIWRGGRAGEPELLRRAYWNSLALAAEHGAATIAFPSISTGAHGYPIKKAAPIALGTAREFILEHPSAFREVRFVLFSELDLSVYRQALGALPPCPQAVPAGRGS